MHQFTPQRTGGMASQITGPVNGCSLRAYVPDELGPGHGPARIHRQPREHQGRLEHEPSQELTVQGAGGWPRH